MGIITISGLSLGPPHPLNTTHEAPCHRKEIKSSIPNSGSCCLRHARSLAHPLVCRRIPLQEFKLKAGGLARSHTLPRSLARSLAHVIVTHEGFVRLWRASKPFLIPFSAREFWEIGKDSHTRRQRRAFSMDVMRKMIQPRS